jgi:hypothetical protein
MIHTINQIRDTVSIETIYYHATGETYSVEKFGEEIDSYETQVLPIPREKQKKTLYDGIIYDSDTEKRFAK